MPHATIATETPFESLVVEQALAFAREMESTANGAADGKVLDQCELLRTILAGAAQQQADAVEKKGPRLAPVNVDIPAETRGARHAAS